MSSLTHEATRHARFYVITNNNPNLAEANVISSVFTGVTDQGSGATATAAKVFEARNAGFGVFGGYDTIPDLITIQQNSGKSCGSDIINQRHYHNGSSALPILNDRIKTNLTLKNFQGGSDSVPSIYGTKPYYVLSLSTTQQSNSDHIAQIDRFYVIQYSTAKVVSILDCSIQPPSITYSTSVTEFKARQAGFGSDFGYDTIPTHAEIRNKNTANNFGTDCGDVIFFATIFHNGSSEFPIIGDRVKGELHQNYSGGSNSFREYYAGSKYFALAVFDNTIVGSSPQGQTARITKHIVVEFSNVTIVAIYDCP